MFGTGLKNVLFAEATIKFWRVGGFCAHFFDPEPVSPPVSGKKMAKKNRTESDFFWGGNGGSSFPPPVWRDFKKWVFLKIGQKWPSAENEGRKTAYFCRTGGLPSRNLSKRSVS